MKPGSHSSEFWLAAFWSLNGAVAAAWLLSLAFFDWKAAFVCAPAVMILLYMAGIIANNFGENRFQLKKEAAASGGTAQERPKMPPLGFHGVSQTIKESEE